MNGVVKDRPLRVVIPIIAGMGNSLMAIPMIRQIKRAWPDCKITILARNKPIGEPVKRLREVDEVLYTGVGIKALFRSVIWTRRLKPDLYIIPFPSNRPHYSLLAMTSGAKKKILHSYPAGKWRAMHFIGERIAAQKGIHDVVQNLRLLEPLGIKPDLGEIPRFNISPDDRAAAKKLLESVGLSLDTPFIAVHAGSGSYTVIAQAKRWLPQYYAELIAKMHEEFGHRVLLLEGPDESGVADEITKHFSSPPRGFFVLKLTGPLGEAAGVLERAIVYVGSDSGLAHLAASVGKRAVTIFAPADPDRVCPYGSRDLVVQAETSCSPCFTYPFKTPYTDSLCREPYCINTVTVDRVMMSVRRAMTSLHPLPVSTGAR
ncbi:MAG TPA: glycosyltransferase family 9 protein [Tepidisphaeraceae bacterium]|nr:glycosyltransferase family 9 protein [Tepidisphaeraceae bacterium]